MQKKYFFLAATSKIVALSLFLFILILCAPSKKLLAQEFAQKRSQSFAYNFSSTILWQLGATTMAANPLVYYFFPFTYTRAISNRIAYSQFIMYRYEHYKNISSENPYSLWRRFHEIYILPGLRFKPKYNQHGKYVAFYAGFGRGIGPNLSLWSINFMPEVGYLAKPFHKRFFVSFNFALLFSGPLYQVPARYTWDQFTAIGVMAHMIIPLFGFNIGWAF